MKKQVYRISPAVSSTGNCWHVELVTSAPDTMSMISCKGYFKTLKRAKGVVAHLNRKPIEIAKRS